MSNKNGAAQAPQITITDAAATQLRAALAEADPGDAIHMEIDMGFVVSMDIGPGNASALAAESNGLTIFFESESAGRAEGLHIDFLETARGAGFSIDNPNAPAKVLDITPAQLKAMLDSGEVKELFDVRTLGERAIATIAGARLLDEAAAAYIETLDRETPLAFHCHHGPRSSAAAQHFCALGFRKLFNLYGGIEAWSLQIDSKVPRY